MIDPTKTSITGEELATAKIFLGTPMYGGQCHGLYTKSVADLSMICAANNIQLKHYFLFNESLVQRARNYIVDEFLRSDCTHLLFIDSDIGFDPRDVLAMLGIQIKNPNDVDVICAPYPKKTIAWEKINIAAKMGKGDESPFELEEYSADYVFNIVDTPEPKIGSPVMVGESGTGFMLIPRETFTKFADAYPEQRYRPDHARTENFDGSHEITAFFDCIIDPESRRYLSEDYFFCRRLRDIGGKIWMCPWMKLTHVGTHLYRADLGKMSQLRLAATADSSSSKKNYRKPSKFKQNRK